MSECTERGCRKLETKCADCGRLVIDRIMIPNWPDWISVKDRLPNDQQKVLFYLSEREAVYAGYFSVNSYGTIEKFGKFRENLDDWWFDEETVDYWMPLPGSPE